MKNKRNHIKLLFIQISLLISVKYKKSWQKAGMYFSVEPEPNLNPIDSRWLPGKEAQAIELSDCSPYFFIY